MAKCNSENLRRWTVKRRIAQVVSSLSGETEAHEAARKHSLTASEVEDWKEQFRFCAETALRSRPCDEDALTDEQIKRLKQKVGGLALDIGIF